MSIFNRRQAEAETPTRPEKLEVHPPAQAQQPIGFESVLGASTTLEGTLRSNNNVRLDGTFTGTLEISGNILVGETAQIKADINARNISIAGAVHGNVTGKKVQILRTGRVWGDISATALTTEEGAFIDGKISMLSHEAARKAQETEAPVEMVDELEPLIEEAREQGLEPEDTLSSLEMTAEGAPPEPAEDHDDEKTE